MRDFFYAKNMHGVDWNAVYDKYNALIPCDGQFDDTVFQTGEIVCDGILFLFAVFALLFRFFSLQRPVAQFQQRRETPGICFFPDI